MWYLASGRLLARLEMRYFLWWILLVIALAIAACELDAPAVDETSDDVPPEIATVESTAPVVTRPVSAVETSRAPGQSYELSSIDGLLGGLDSYDLALSWRFEGQSASAEPLAWQISSREIKGREPMSTYYELSVNGLPSGIEIESMSKVNMEGGSFLEITGVGCISAEASRFESTMHDPIELSSIIDGMLVTQLLEAGAEANGLTGDRYAIDEGNLPMVKDQGLEAEGEVFVVEPEAYPSRIVLGISGEADFLSRGVQETGHLFLELNLQDVNMPIVSAPCSDLISPSLRATKSRASSQDASRNVPFSLISGVLRRSGEWIKSYPNRPLTQRLP